MKDRVKKSMLEVTQILDFAAFEDPKEWDARKREAKREDRELPVPGDCTGWMAPPTWQVEEESEIRYNLEADEIELAMRFTDACSCCAEQSCYLQWMTVPTLIEKLRKKHWIVFQGDGNAVTAKTIKRLEAFHKKFKNP